MADDMVYALEHIDGVIYGNLFYGVLQNTITSKTYV